MTDGGKIWITYTFFFLATTTFSFVVNAIFLKLASNLGIRNRSDTIIRWSEVAKPALGGISFYIAFLFSIAFYGLMFTEAALVNEQSALGILGATSLAFVMGLGDDAYNTKPLLKFSAQLACGLILVFTGTFIHISDSLWINGIVTCIWVIGIMNSINMLDNMDGITAITACGIIFIGMLYLFSVDKLPSLDFVVLLGVMGALVGFLFVNWYPSKMFMGDTGSQFLGIFLAIAGINFFWNSEPSHQLFIKERQIIIVLLAFALPIIDTTSVIINRLTRKQSPFVGGRDHTTHHLSYLGMSDVQVAITFLSLSILSILLNYIIFNFISTWNIFHNIIFFTYFFALFSILYYITTRNKNRRTKH